VPFKFNVRRYAAVVGERVEATREEAEKDGWGLYKLHAVDP
jgi:hypothetical protein